MFYKTFTEFIYSYASEHKFAFLLDNQSFKGSINKNIIYLKSITSITIMKILKCVLNYFSLNRFMPLKRGQTNADE